MYLDSNTTQVTVFRAKNGYVVLDTDQNMHTYEDSDTGRQAAALAHVFYDIAEAMYPGVGGELKLALCLVDKEHLGRLQELEEEGTIQDLGVIL